VHRGWAGAHRVDAAGEGGALGEARAHNANWPCATSAQHIERR
jgi:hypothetical protein